MKRYTLSGHAADSHVPEHPERTARRNASSGVMDFDVTFQVWPNRAAMLRTVHMQESGYDFAKAWRPCVTE